MPTTLETLNTVIADAQDIITQLTGLLPQFTPPAVVTGLVTGAQTIFGQPAVTLHFDPVAGATGYKVHEGLAAAGPFTTVAGPGPATSYGFGNKVSGTTYFYYVTALNGAGESAPSAVVSQVA